jgi:hypothetical protein
MDCAFWYLPRKAAVLELIQYLALRAFAGDDLGRNPAIRTSTSSANSTEPACHHIRCV